MIESGLLSQVITIVTPGETNDAYGNIVESWADADVATRVRAAYVRPIPTSVRPAGNENVDAGRNVVEVAWQVHTNDLDVTALDRVVFDGVVYAVDGQPLTWSVDPSGEVGHTKLLLRRVDG
jgi:head-tail adaptor